MPNIFGYLAQAWVDNVTTLLDKIWDMAGIWDSTGRRLKYTRRGVFDFPPQGARYDPFKTTRRSLYGAISPRRPEPYRGLFGAVPA